ncbi:YybH family protein [Streptomyces albipurpureus]|uniref:SgcJ/EcaC family oxidoreductase n=1 Tax=Streptomyces albipurpureus TaxID=2897419 RepID=A0ABT0UGR4_9ACTN|nr:SgcJ/EcaC family oxidoreductase [Streptomyces sp. CWNU-1]MCM2387630.1 SgcJ/EcaC family oxidoreductase [Streptomyces sp. CWNU-1]
MAEDTQSAAVRDLLTVYERALNASDARLAVSLYSPEGVFLPFDGPTATGAQELLEGYEAIFATIRLEVAFTVDDISVDGATAHALTRSEGHSTDLATGTRSPERNRELFVFDHADGSWRIARYMFNKPV